jgi:O-antigen ligase
MALAALLALACVLGGGTQPGLPGDGVLQLLAVPLLGLGLIRLRRDTLGPLGRYALAWLGLVLALFVLHLLPLPSTVWTALGGRTELAAELIQASVPVGWHALSLNPYATERMLWSLLPPVAVFVATLGLDEAARRRLLPLLFALAALGTVLGMAQVADGPESPLRPFAITNPTEAVGFFANRNHYAALLYAVLPLALATFAARLAERNAGRAVPLLGLLALALLVMLLIVGLVLSRSRAGLVLGMAGLFAGVAIAFLRLPAGRGRARIARGVVVTGVLGLVLAVQYGLYGILERLDNDPLDDARWTVLGVTLDAARHFGALGSGLGTFQNAYQRFETPQVQFTAYVNHAHDDWAELWLEAGWPAAMLAALLLGWLLLAAVRAWRHHGSSPLSTLLPCAASVGPMLYLLHATVDYSLRTSANLCVFAFLCALLVPAARPRGARATNGIL